MLPNFRRDTDNIFYSKIDAWLALTIMFAAFIVISACIALCLNADETSFVKTMLFVLFFLFFETAIFLLIADAFIRCRYIFNEDHLYIQSGIFVRVGIPYASIKSFRESNNVLSAPACSLDRIEIAYNDESTGKESFILVSPRNKQAFKEKLDTIIKKNM